MWSRLNGHSKVIISPFLLSFCLRVVPRFAGNVNINKQLAACNQIYWINNNIPDSAHFHVIAWTLAPPSDRWYSAITHWHWPVRNYAVRTTYDFCDFIETTLLVPGAPAGFQARVGKIRREAPKNFFVCPPWFSICPPCHT